MFDGLFGTEMPLAAKFFIAFAVVLGLIALTAWVVRRFGAARLGNSANRGRQPRLAVIDAASVDGRRRLVLIRRDNVEHLLMIGGPSDVVVEPNIVRAAGLRDGARDTGRGVSDTLPRALPLEGNGGTSWPLQPAPEPAAPTVAPAPSRAYRPAVSDEPWLPPAEPTPPRRASVDMAGLAGELTARPRAEPRPEPRPEPKFESKFDTKFEAKPEPRVEARAEPRIEPRAEPRTEPRNEPRAEPKPEFQFDTSFGRTTTPPPPEPTRRAPDFSAEPAAKGEARSDQNLSEMAQRLEAALRRAPGPTGQGPVTDPLAVTPEPATRPRTEPSFASEPKRSSESAKPEKSDKTAYDNLEQEMASLLGRPASKL